MNLDWVATLEVFAAMKTQVVVFWVVTPCSDVIGVTKSLKMEAACSSETLVSYRICCLV